MALHETIALDYAVAKGLELTNEHETLTIVTADHSHPLTLNGFPFRGQSILGNYEPTSCVLSSKIFAMSCLECIISVFGLEEPFHNSMRTEP